ncbi:MAG: hypothetical protein ABL995_17475 [Bryobacteraceae bacterium]
MPRFGYLHDDGILYGSAFGLATSSEYQIVSLPERPFQTKYPPLYPLYMSMVWKLNPKFPENLALATFFNWLLLPVFLALCWNVFRPPGFGESSRLCLMAFLSVNVVLLLFGISVMTELFFTCGLLVVLLVMEKDTRHSALLAGILAGAVYLSRTAGIALLAAGPAWYLWKRTPRRAFLFAIGMAPFVVAWTSWSRAHQLPTNEPGIVFYTDYVRFQLLNVDAHNFGRVVVSNLRELFYGMGSLFFPKVSDSALLKVSAAAAVLATVSGCLRMMRNGAMQAYGAFAIVSLGILAVWHYPPNERFLLPLLPFFAAGIATELLWIAGHIRNAAAGTDTGNRIASWVLGGVLAVGVSGIVVTQLYGVFRFLPRMMETERAHQSALGETYSWIAAHVPVGSQVLSADDPVLFLYTGLRGNTVPLLPRDWYEGGSATPAIYANIADYCRRRHLDYFLYGPEDLARHWTRPENADEIQRILNENHALEAIHTSPAGTVYRVLPAAN